MNNEELYQKMIELQQIVIFTQHELLKTRNEVNELKLRQVELEDKLEMYESIEEELKELRQLKEIIEHHDEYFN